MDRREFLKTVGVGSLALLGGGLLTAHAAKPAPPPPKPRPLGTCGGWTDKEGNGSCDHSEKKEKPCGKTVCPGHVKNADRAKAAEAGAPAGTCAAWRDARQRGFCESSTIAGAKRCTYAVCPAHKDYKTPEKKT